MPRDSSPNQLLNRRRQTNRGPHRGDVRRVRQQWARAVSGGVQAACEPGGEDYCGAVGFLDLEVGTIGEGAWDPDIGWG